jgi:tRNA pseudouridine32 synthase/23S rRNA pseudouridine746 synthase
MQAMGHPILGDEFYAGPQALMAAPQLQLHATELGFRHPLTAEKVLFSCAAPFEL